MERAQWQDNTTLNIGRRAYAVEQATTSIALAKECQIRWQPLLDKWQLNYSWPAELELGSIDNTMDIVAERSDDN
jgi:hypothetical protein